MNIDFSAESIIKTRRSIRTYDDQEILDQSKIDLIQEYMDQLSNPFQEKVRFNFLIKEASENGEKLGTYGVIKGAEHFIGAAVMDSELSLEALGYEFEMLVLYITSLGFGTCWLGGTFNKSEFASAMKIQENELFPVISPIGIPHIKTRLSDSFARWAAKSDKRKNWEDIFFNENLNTILTKQEAGKYEKALEYIRLAPSAVNKQPWRIVQSDSGFHFYKYNKSPEKKQSMDLQKVDMGIAACHFHLGVLENNIVGNFQKMKEHPDLKNDKYKYEFSWIEQII